MEQTMTHPFARRLAAELAVTARSSHHASHRVRRCGRVPENTFNPGDVLNEIPSTVFFKSLKKRDTIDFQYFAS
jgi:hypothetical protein